MEEKKSASFRLGTKIILILLLLFFFALATGISFGLSYMGKFSAKLGLSSRELVKEMISGLKAPYQEKYLTILLLGLDQREEERTLLTDTILLATINTQTGNYLLFSFPRDLWLDDLKTKINALYYYGNDQLVKERLESILAWQIDYVLVLKMEQIRQLVDLIGGMEVEIENSFVDEEFPQQDGKVIRVEFKAGKEILNGERALQFMRSRKSTDLVEGTDEARQKRQKKVILSLKEKLIKEKNLWLNPEKMADLFLFFTEQIEIKPSLDFARVASFWKVAWAIVSEGSQQEKEIPWRGEQAILVSDRDPLYHTWILLPKDNNWDLIKNYFYQNLPP